MTRQIVLFVLTGIHAGAEIALSEGSYVFGASEECDILLTDASLRPRHFSLTVPAAGAPLLTPLEGVISLRGKSCGTGSAIPEGTPFFAAPVCFVWLADGKSFAALDLPSLLKESPVLDDGVGASPRPDAPGRLMVRASGAESAAGPKAAPPARRRGAKWALRGLILAMLLALMVWFNTAGMSPEEQSARLAAALAEAGLNDVSVELRNGMVAALGLAKDADELRTVRDVAQDQPFQVQVIMRTHEEFVRLVRSTLAAHAIFPQVLINGKSASLHGYVRDTLVERAALSWLRGSVPSIAEIGSSLVTEKLVAPVLLKELQKAGLSGKITPDWQAGVVALNGALKDREAERLLEVMNAVRRELKSPIAFQMQSDQQIYVGDPPKREDAAVKVHARSAAGKDFDNLPVSSEGDGGSPFSGNFSLRSVAPVDGGASSAQALPFITTSDGRVYFLGGILPGDYVLTGIYPDRLEFSKNNSPSTFKLQGWQHGAK